MKDIINEKYYKYALQVTRGEIVACKMVIDSCKRFLNDLEREDLIFRKDKVDKAIKFISILKHFKGSANGKNFILEPFQLFIVANLIGWYWKESGYRRFTSAYIEMARKGGKTALIAAIAMYYFIADGEAGAEVDICANVKSQAYICFEFIEQFAKQLDPKQRDLKIYRDYITMKANNSKINVFSSDDKGKDGFNASVGIVDEFHSARNTKMRDVIKSSMGNRENPMLLTITSAGFDKTLPCYQLRTTCLEILSGLKTDDSLFCMIFGLDEDDDWTNEDNWIKSNPNLGKTVSLKYLREQVNSAKNNPTEETSVRTKNLGQWLTSTEIWIPDVYLYQVSEKVNLEDFANAECNVGIDLSSVSDMTAVSFLLQRDNDEKLYFKTLYYLPESCLTESSNKELYKYWVQTKQLNLTSGNVIDYDYIINDIMKWNDKIFIRKISFDPYNSTQAVLQMQDLGLTCEAYSQSIGNFNKPSRELERLIRSKQVVIDSNEITLWMFRNVDLKNDWNNNIKPVKVHKDKKIDGVIAMIEALGGYLETPRFSGGVYAI